MLDEHEKVFYKENAFIQVRCFLSRCLIDSSYFHLINHINID